MLSILTKTKRHLIIFAAIEPHCSFQDLKLFGQKAQILKIFNLLVLILSRISLKIIICFKEKELKSSEFLFEFEQTKDINIHGDKNMMKVKYLKSIKNTNRVSVPVKPPFRQTLW